MNLNLEIGLILLEELALIGLPLVAAAMFAASRGIRSPVLLVAIALVASGAAAMVVFWGFYLSPEVGKTLTFLIEIGSAAGALALWFLSPAAREPLRELAVPFALWVAASFFIVYLGFLHGLPSGIGPFELAAHRFSGTLPDDNALPAAFGDWFYVHGHNGTPPPVSEWLASDRPPLQMGYVVAVRPFGWDLTAIHYTVLGVVLQQLWVPAMWALLRAADLGRRARALALIAAMVSDIAILHGFFVWPKLLAAAFVLAAAAMALSPEWRRWARDPWAAALFASLCALAMLSHGSSVFALVPLLAYALWRGRPNPRWLAVALGAALLFYLPWTAYQHWGDPPGDRLVKWQLGGNPAISEEGVLKTIVDGYKEEGLGGAISNKWTNLQAIIGIGEVKAIHESRGPAMSSGWLERAIENVRWVRFLALLPNLGFLLLGFLGLAVRAVLGGPRRTPEWRFALWSGALALVAVLFWALLMFGNPVSEAVLHQGCLAVPLLAIVACVSAAWAADRRFAIGLVAFNALFVLFLYVPAPLLPDGSYYSPVAELVAALALAAFCWAAIADPAESESPPAAA